MTAYQGRARIYCDDPKASVIAWLRAVPKGPYNVPALVNRCTVKRELARWTTEVPKPGTRFRLADGHLPEHCPVVSESEARAWLELNPFGIAWRVK